MLLPALQLHQGLRTFSLSATSDSSLSTPALQRPFLGWLFFMAVWWTNTSSLVSFLLVRPLPFLTLNHFTVPKTFLVMTFLSLQAGATIMRLPGPPLPVPLPVVPGLLSAALRGAAAVSQPRCSDGDGAGCSGSSGAVMVTSRWQQWGCSGLSGVCSLLLIELENIFYIRWMSASIKSLYINICDKLCIIYVIHKTLQ